MELRQYWPPLTDYTIYETGLEAWCDAHKPAHPVGQQEVAPSSSVNPPFPPSTTNGLPFHFITGRSSGGNSVFACIRRSRSSDFSITTSLRSEFDDLPGNQIHRNPLQRRQGAVQIDLRLPALRRDRCRSTADSSPARSSPTTDRAPPHRRQHRRIFFVRKNG